MKDRHKLLQFDFWGLSFGQVPCLGDLIFLTLSLYRTVCGISAHMHSAGFTEIS